MKVKKVQYVMLLLNNRGEQGDSDFRMGTSVIVTKR